MAAMTSDLTLDLLRLIATYCGLLRLVVACYGLLRLAMTSDLMQEQMRTEAHCVG